MIEDKFLPYHDGRRDGDLAAVLVRCPGEKYSWRVYVWEWRVRREWGDGQVFEEGWLSPHEFLGEFRPVRAFRTLEKALQYRAKIQVRADLELFSETDVERRMNSWEVLA